MKIPKCVMVKLKDVRIGEAFCRYIEGRWKRDRLCIGYDTTLLHNHRYIVSEYVDDEGYRIKDKIYEQDFDEQVCVMRLP